MSFRAPTIPVRLSWLSLAWMMAAGPVSGQAFHEQAKLVASDAAPEARFGCSVALEGDTAVVGARYETHSTWFRAGAAYVLVRSGSTWSEQAKLVASDARPYDFLGNSVALSGDTILAGAYWDDVWYFGALKRDTGSARVFVRSGTIWSEQATLTKSVPIGAEAFGRSVALDGDTALVGASSDRNLGLSTGSAYVFVRNGTTWSEQARLLASDGAHGDAFGSSVALDADTAVVCAGADGYPNEPFGSAYVFVRTGAIWTEQAKLLPSDGAVGDSFGNSVALSGDTVVIGASLQDLPGVPDTSAGAAYVFTRVGSMWTEQAKLVLADARPSDRFGNSVALSGDRALISADDRPRNDGAAFVFERTGTTWAEVARLTAADDSRGLGTGVALSGDTLLVGAENDDHCAGQEGGAYVFGPTPGPTHPRILSISPTGTPALVPGTAQTISITGTDLDLTTELLLECVPVEPARYTIVGPTLITLDMPQAPMLGYNHLSVGDGVYIDSIRINVEYLTGPAYQIGNGDPFNVVDRDNGVSYILAGPVGSVQYLFVSRSNLPSVNRYVSLDIGNQFTQLSHGSRFVIPASGWLQVTVPHLHDPGPTGVILYSQTLEFAAPVPFEVSNSQSITVVQ